MIFDNKWLRVVKLNGWFISCEPGTSKDNKAVAVLPYRRDEYGDPVEFLSRIELNPAHMVKDEEHQISIITGACETGDALYHARMELIEEGGYDIPEDRFEFLGIVNPQKSSSTRLYLYAVEITDEDIQGFYEGDGSYNESKEYCEWICSTIMIIAKDPYIQTIILRLMTKDAISAKTWKEIQSEAIKAAKEHEYMVTRTPGSTH